MTNGKSQKDELIASRECPLILYRTLGDWKSGAHRQVKAVRKLLYAGLREWKLEYTAKLYRDNKMTLAMAAEEAGISVSEMMERFRQNKVPMQYDTDDFERDLKSMACVMVRWEQVCNPNIKVQTRA